MTHWGGCICSESFVSNEPTLKKKTWKHYHIKWLFFLFFCRFLTTSLSPADQLLSSTCWKEVGRRFVFSTDPAPRFSLPTMNEPHWLEYSTECTGRAYHCATLEIAFESSGSVSKPPAHLQYSTHCLGCVVCRERRDSSRQPKARSEILWWFRTTGWPMREHGGSLENKWDMLLFHHSTSYGSFCFIM